MTKMVLMICVRDGSKGRVFRVPNSVAKNFVFCITQFGVLVSEICDDRLLSRFAELDGVVNSALWLFGDTFY